MRSITYPQYFRADGYRTLIKMTAPNSTIRESNILLGGFTYDNRMVEGSGFQVGTAIAAEINVTLDNTSGLYDKTFLGKEYSVQLAAIKTNGTESESSLPSNRWFKLGTFIVVDVDESNAQAVTMTLQDRMVLMDKVIPSFTAGTLYANLNSFCTALGITFVGNVSRVQALKKFNVVVTENENKITYRDFVRGCALLLGANAYMNDITLDFRTFNTTSLNLGPADRYSSRLREKYKLGGVQVVDEEGTVLWSRNTSTTDNCRIVIAPDTSVIFDLVGGITEVAQVYTDIYGTSQTSYYPPAFEALPKEYYPVEMTAMNWWEVEPGDVITYTDKQGRTYSCIVTSMASVANGKTSITSTADEEEREVPMQTDAIRTTTLVAREASETAQSAHDIAVNAMPKYGSNTQSGSTVAKTVTISDFTLTQGQRVTVLFENKNTAASPTLNVSGTGAYAIKTADNGALPNTDVADPTQVGWGANSLVTFVFDGNVWRIDDSAALTKIDHILTEDIVGDNGWINLKEGEFVFTDADTGDSLGFNDGYLTLTGTISGSVIDGEELNIEGHGNLSGQLDTYPDYSYRIRTKNSRYNYEGNDFLYRSIELASWLNRGSLAETICESRIFLDPANGISIEGFPPEYIGDFLKVSSLYDIRMGSDDGSATGNYLYIENVDAFLSNTNYNNVANILGLTPITRTGTTYSKGSLYDVLITLANEAFYAPGDGLSLSLTALAGIVTTSATKARITIPVAKSLANISTISVDVCKGGIRVPAAGYLDGVGDSTDWIGRSGITVSAEKEGDYYITLSIDKTSAFSNVSNNMPVVMWTSDVSLSFS